jgi:7-cyano-7-deazaguanine synthase
MSPVRENQAVGVLMSGGLDSSILVGHLLRSGCRVQPFYVESHLVWQQAELRAARRFLEALSRSSRRVDRLVVLELPLTDLYDRHWSVTGTAPPDATSDDSAVFLPGRNALLLLKPAIWCQLHGIQQLALGVLGTNPFADAAPPFFEAFQATINRDPACELRVIRPFAALPKREVMERGRGLPLELTFSCIAPVDGLHCGQCNKCAERQAAFGLIDAVDPTTYSSSPPIGAGRMQSE